MRFPERFPISLQKDEEFEEEEADSTSAVHRCLAVELMIESISPLRRLMSGSVGARRRRASR